ncbi:hypothetical protein BJF79_43475 [Actinomadura sp. CNU-125]|uniref:hypothetical protein n=1 Tax=Actinomadura sp. CNU-125 TaxID=1904961 RepID=UPI0009614209|nr:hypothetical protein [Actinomadura sp. CNU-125]OLT26520.1 hypothetical protein BJF79_43475 [Actinomadura sp. CNU-125]
MAEGDDFARRLIVSADAKGYGSTTANWQRHMQDGLCTVLERAAERAGLDRPGWWIQPGGDGEIAVLPDSEPEPRVVDDYVRHLHAELRRYNRDVPSGRELRLRMAVHYGPAIPARHGRAGGGLVVAARLCDSEALRRALDGTGAALAVVLSERVFTETVAEEHTTLDPADFTRVGVRMKEFTGHAWIHVPGHDLDGMQFDVESDEDDEDDGPGTAPSVPPRAQAAGAAPAGDYAGAQIRARTFIGRDQVNHGNGDPR